LAPSKKSADTTRRAVFLDRDGVLNKVNLEDGKPASPTKIEQFHLLPDLKKWLQFFKDKGLMVIVITNQPEVRRGLLKANELEKMHLILREKLPVDEIIVCPHDDRDGCECRKPKPGMLYRAASRFGIDLQGSFIIGDSWKDMEAGTAAGCRTILIDKPYNQGVKNDYRVKNIEEAVGVVKRCLDLPRERITTERDERN